MEVSVIPFDKTEIVNKIYTACRTCYMAGTPQEQYKKTQEELVGDEGWEKKWKLINHVISSGHHSTLEHVSFTFLVSGVSRALSHQFVRHRIGVSYCLSGDTIIKQRSHGESKTIKELFESTQQYNCMRRIRCVNEDTHELQYDPIKSIIYSGVKPVYEVETEFGYKIKSTMQHMFFTPNGWKQLEEINIGDVVYVNGIPAYQDKEWLKTQYHTLNKSQEEIGLECGVSKHTIRKWVRLYGLQKEIGSWSIGVEPVNKGRTKYDYAPMAVTSQKMMGNNNAPKLYGCNNHGWRGDDITIRGGYTRTHRNNDKTGICSNCGAKGETHLHHIDKNPKNASSENIKELCPNCHKAIHKKEIKEVIIPNKIVSIKYIGNVDTYDIEMAGDNHNFIANGFVVHNSQQSQRYCEFKDGNFNFVYPPTVLKSIEATKVFDECIEKISQTYSDLINLGIPAEDARMVLPNACCTNLTVTMNLRELIHFTDERCCTCAQWEIRDMANRMAKLIYDEIPELKTYLGPKCTSLGYCNESAQRSCGRKPTLKQMKEDLRELARAELHRMNAEIIAEEIKKGEC